MHAQKETVLPLLILTFLALCGSLLFKYRLASLQTPNTFSNLEAKNAFCVPTFADGDGPYYESNAPERNEITPATASGELLVVTGTVTENDCVTPVADAVLDIWQADERGFYDRQWYRGRVRTDNKGLYYFKTVVPKGYGEGTAYRPPHIHFKVWQGSTLRITSEMFLPAARAQGIQEAYIMQLETNTKNGTLVHEGSHHIVLP